MKKLLVTILALSFLITACDKKKEEAKAEKPIVKIGAVLPLTGDSAHSGNLFKGAIQTAIQDANSNPENRYTYEAIFEDSQLSLAKMPPIISKLTMADKVDGIISFTAHIAQPIIPVAKEKGIIHIMSFWGTELADGKYNFLNWTQPEELVEKLVENIKAKGYKKVQSVCWLQQGVVALEKVLETELQKHNIDYDKAWVPGGERDMRLLIRKMQTNNPDLYIPVLFDPELSVFIKQLRDANIKTDVASMEVFSLINNPELINGAWFIDVADANTSAMQKIKQYNKSDATYGLGLMYDDVMLMVYAFENAPDKAAAAKVLSDLKEYDGISGKLTQVNGTFKSQGILKEIKEGKFIVVE